MKTKPAPVAIYKNPRQYTIDGSEIPNNHMGSKNKRK